MAIPDYVTAAQSHTVLNSTEESWTDTILNIPKTVGLGIGAGVAEILNVPITVGNWLPGVDIDRINYKAALQSLDTDLGQYYDDHKLGIDTIGFITGSIVPGMAGVKVLRGGQAMLRTASAEGMLGENLGTAFGLLAPKHTEAIAAAQLAIRQSGNVFALSEANTLRALATGVGQATLESAAFETAVAATMYQSPVLDSSSISDLTWNVALGTVLGGAIGGVFTGVGSAYKIIGAGQAAKDAMRPFEIAMVPRPNAPASEKALFRQAQIEQIQNDLNYLHVSPLEKDIQDRAIRTAGNSIAKLWGDIRADLGDLAGKDQAIAGAAYQTMRLNNLDGNLVNMLDSAALTRANVSSQIESDLKKLMKKAKDTNYVMTQEEVKAFNEHRVNYIKIHGEGMGSSSPEHPAVLTLTDKYKGDIELTDSGIAIGKKKWAMENNPHRAFNILGVDKDTVAARRWWSEMTPKWNDSDFLMGAHQVHANDLPLIEKAHRDGLSKLSVIPESGEIAAAINLNSREEILSFMNQKKLEIGQRLQNAQPRNISIGDFIDKFKNAFGVNFNMVDEASSNYNGFFQRLLSDKSKTGGLVLKGDAIALDQIRSLTRPLKQVMDTLLHERGHSTFQAMLDAKGVTVANLSIRMPLLYTELRTIGAARRKSYYDNQWARLRAGTPDLDEAGIIHEYFADTFLFLSKNPESINRYPALKDAIGHLVQPIPQEVIDSVSQRLTKTSLSEAAQIVNTEVGWLDGTARREGGNLARDMARKEYTEKSIQAGIRPSEILDDPLRLPSVMKVVTKVSSVTDTGFPDGNELLGMAKIAQQSALYDAASTRRATEILGRIYPGMPPLVPLSNKEVLLPLSAGPTLLTSANANYGTLGSKFQLIGSLTKTLINKAKESVSDLFLSDLTKISNNLDDAIGWSVMNEKLRNLPQKYYLNEDGSALMYGKAPLEEMFDNPEAYQKAATAYSELIANAALTPSIPLTIPIPEGLRSIVANHISKNGEHVKNRKIIRAGEGLKDNLDPEAFYPIPRNPKDTPHFAFVVDDSFTSTGHSKMIYASSDKNLEIMKNEIISKMPNVKVYTKAESEAYFKNHGEFEFERTINENYINEQMARSGVSASYLPLTDPTKIVDQFMQWHLTRAATGVREAMSHAYSRQFEALRTSAIDSTNAATSKFGYSGTMGMLESAVDNPATNLIKMALDVQKNTEYPFWSSMNKLLDQKVSQLFANAGAVLTDATTPQHLADISNSLRKAGYNGISEVSEGLYRAMNGTVPRGALTGFINKANGLLATFALRMDFLNAMNNTIGQTILLGTEANSVYNGIMKGNKEAVGALSELAHVKIPGMQDSIHSPTKVIAAAMREATDSANVAWAKQNGFSTSITTQYNQTMDMLAISAGDTVASLQKRAGDALDIARRIGDAGERLTGNTWAEEYTRTVAALTMKKYTDVAIQHGVMDEATAMTYIGTFVNRVQGNFIASQRPLLFQGPIGQAMGLFQTYQFNLLQQLTRHIGEGQTKNAALMLGLQGTIYGANGLPGFAALNTHIIGSASGNTQHTDMYRAMYNGVGKEAGDWMMYGLGSNWMGIFDADLKNNLYSRGDINPRNISVIPASPLDYPIVQASAKFVSNIAESVKKINAGADVWATILRGIEQNGVSRPLVGMAQVLGGMTADSGKVTSISSKGNILMAHDTMNLASLTRIVGGKPLDEALVNDAMFRFNAYRATDAARKATLGEAIKISILGGSPPDQDQIDTFALSYARAGGDQKDFAHFMLRQYKNATESQANQLRARLSSPYNQTLQELMNGRRLPDMNVASQSELGASN